MRLGSGRRLYDRGVLLGACPSLASLVPAAVVAASPHDLEGLGVAPGGHVRVRSARGSLIREAAADGSLPRGVVSVDFNLDSGDTAAAALLIDSRQPVVDVRLETP
jgi:predicted molibdopterin-dependent oxidoreductase YjgC